MNRRERANVGHARSVRLPGREGKTDLSGDDVSVRPCEHDHRVVGSIDDQREEIHHIAPQNTHIQRVIINTRRKRAPKQRRLIVITRKLKLQIRLDGVQWPTRSGQRRGRRMGGRECPEDWRAEHRAIRPAVNQEP